MASPSRINGLCSNGSLRLRGRVVWFFLAMCLVGWTIGVMFYSMGRLSDRASCPCNCDCPDQSALNLASDFNYGLFADYINNTYADCGKHDPALREEMEKDLVALISEEITLQKTVADDSLARTQELIMDARQTSSRYQREADKCKIQMETCEEAREKAEEKLVEELKLTQLWEERARDLELLAI